jgi:hypothetical protein
VKLSVSEEALATRACWCRVCQYIGTGSGTVNAIFRRDTLRVAGETRDFACRADSGNHMHRHFCPNCGTHLFATVDERPDIVVVRVGALDDRESLRPASTIWVSSAPGWACIDASLPQVQQQPAPVG